MERIVELERLAARAWPARETTRLGSWELRYADGYSRRANTVLPWDPWPDDLPQRLERAREWYAARGLPLRFRITPLCGGLANVLLRWGFAVGDAAVVLAGALPQPEPPPGFTVATEPTERWIGAQLRLAGDARRPERGWRAILQRIDRLAGFATLREGAEIVAAGLVVVDGRWAGVHQVVVSPQRRRRGKARQLMDGLHDWARRHGATAGWLQVATANRPAISLYRSLGYRSVYGYRYLVPQGPVPRGPARRTLGSPPPER